MTRPPRGPLVFFLVLVALAAASVGVLDWDLSSVESLAALRASLERLGSFFAAFGAPDLSAATLSEALDLAMQTLAIALLGVLLALLLAWPLAVLSARSVMQDVDAAFDGDRPRRPLAATAARELARLLLDVLRGVPDFAWALLVYNFTGNGPLTGMLAIGISVAGILGKLYSELWDAVDPRSYAALRSTGASRLTVLLYGIQPLAARNMLSFTLMRAECAVRNASVIGVVGGGGLGVSLFQELNFGNYSKVVTLLGFTLLLTLSADLCANWLRSQFRVDPNHPRAPRSTSLAHGLWRRGLGIGAIAGLLLLGAVYLRGGLAYGLDELHRVDGPFVLDMVGGLLTPDLSWSTLQRAAGESLVPLALGFLATALSALAAGALALPASVAFQLEPHRFTGEATRPLRRLARALLLVAARGLAMLVRGVPEVAWVLILAAFFRMGTIAGLGGMVLHSTGVLARVFTEAVDNVPYRYYEKTFYGSRVQTFGYAALPAVWTDWKTYTMFQLEVNVRMGVVLGIVGVGGLGDVFDTAMDFWHLHQASTFLLAMVLLTVGLDRTSRWLHLQRIACR